MSCIFKGITRRANTCIFVALFVGSGSALSSNELRLCNDPGLSGTCLTFNVLDNTVETIVTLPGDVRDRCSSLQYNLPVGTIVSLMDLIPLTYGDIYNSKGFDLIGTGNDETLDFSDMKKYEIADIIASFVRHEYDVDVGYFELYTNFDLDGNSRKVFLSI